MNRKLSNCNQDNSSGYEIHLSIPANNAVANGSATNTARAILRNSKNGKPVPGKSITFQITAGKATFTNKKQRSNGKTSDEGVAQVDFVNATADLAGEIIAVLTDNPVVKSNTAPYLFVVPPYTINLTVPVNNSCINQAQAVISLNGKPAPSGILVRFQLNPIAVWQYVRFMRKDSDIVAIGNGYVVVRTMRNGGESLPASAWMEANQSLQGKLGAIVSATLVNFPGTKPQSQRVTFTPRSSTSIEQFRWPDR